MAGRTSDLGEWTAYGVDLPVQILQEGEIRGVETLDDLRSHLIVLETAKRGDHSGEEHHGQVVGIGLDPIVKERQQFVASCRQPHDSDPMEGASAVEIAPWELEFEFRLQRWHRLLGISQSKPSEKLARHGSALAWPPPIGLPRCVAHPVLWDTLRRGYGPLAVG